MHRNYHQPARMQMARPPIPNANPYPFRNTPNPNVNMYGGDRMRNCSPFDGAPTHQNPVPPPIPKEVVHLSNCVMYPPNPNAPYPTTNERPLGCRTVFVGGLPDRITDEMLLSIFSVCCGAIERVKMVTKNVCHIRFEEEKYAEKALYFSGYMLKIEDKSELPYMGRLHVGYSKNREDEREYRCKERALRIKARQLKKLAELPDINFSDKGASLICEKLKDEETFTYAAKVLVSWLEKGMCSHQSSSSSIFSVIQCTQSYVKKIQSAKLKIEDEQLYENGGKRNVTKKLEGIYRQLIEMENIFKAASLQKNWDRFTKAQRKNIETWAKEIKELKSMYMEEIINERQEEEMDLSDDEDSDSKASANAENANKLQKDNDSLMCQLGAAQNELLSMQSNHKEELKKKDGQIATLQAALKEMDPVRAQLKEAQNLIMSMQGGFQEELKKKDVQIATMQQALQEIEPLRCQLKGAQDAIIGMSTEYKEEFNKKDSQLAMMQQALQEIDSLRSQLKDVEENLKGKEDTITILYEAVRERRTEIARLNDKCTKYEDELHGLYEFKRRVKNRDYPY